MGRLEGDHNPIGANVLGVNGRGLVFTSNAGANVYRGNMARGSTGSLSCASPCSTDFCGDGFANTSAGDNFMPDAEAPRHDLAGAEADTW
jgi:hypothetical protein